MRMGTRIQQARKRKGYTQEYVAEALDVSRQAVHKWEKDQSKPDTANLIALSELLGVSVEYLIKGEKEDASVHRAAGEPFFRASLIPLLMLPVCWVLGVFSGVYTEMVQIPVGKGISMGLPFLMYGHSPAAITLAIISVVCLILVVLLLFLGAYTNQRN